MKELISKLFKLERLEAKKIFKVEYELLSTFNIEKNRLYFLDLFLKNLKIVSALNLLSLIKLIMDIDLVMRKS
ncbi:hypothetical protein H5J22_00700 [Cetobacterium sp. 8H]|uniref:hypothetical protein n=1 Tax=Cetobacterium sp. 8H TaxID=2759681 RepID=UPI00163D2680|nr:hypothetical protein [Cetobacterium sp. 8H]MBC2849979.1 hypothetical protein [Cetobacterium sp. 8H]